MSYYTSDELAYNERAIKEANSTLNDLEHELYDIDMMLYDGIMNIGHAQGIELLLREDPSIDINKVEEIMKKIRANNTNALESLKNAITSIEAYLAANGGDLSTPSNSNKTKAVNDKDTATKKVLPTKEEDKEEFKKKNENIEEKEEVKDNNEIKTSLLKEKKDSSDEAQKNVQEEPKIIDSSPVKIVDDSKNNEKITERPIATISPDDKQVAKPGIQPKDTNKNDEVIVQPVYGSPVKPNYTNDDVPGVKPIPIEHPGKDSVGIKEPKQGATPPIPEKPVTKPEITPLIDPTKQTKKIPLNNEIPINGLNTGKIPDSEKVHITKPINPKDGIGIVQPVYGSPVKPIYTNDDKPSFTPIPISHPGTGSQPTIQPPKPGHTETPITSPPLINVYSPVTTPGNLKPLKPALQTKKIPVVSTPTPVTQEPQISVYKPQTMTVKFKNNTPINLTLPPKDAKPINPSNLQAKKIPMVSTPTPVTQEPLINVQSPVTTPGNLKTLNPTLQTKKIPMVSTPTPVTQEPLINVQSPVTTPGNLKPLSSTLQTKKIISNSKIPISGLNTGKIPDSEKIHITKPINPKDGIGIVQPVYGSPVKPIYTSDDKPSFTPIPIPHPGEGKPLPVARPNILKKGITSKEMTRQAIIESQKRIMSSKIKKGD